MQFSFWKEKLKETISFYSIQSKLLSHECEHSCILSASNVENNSQIIYGEDFFESLKTA